MLEQNTEKIARQYYSQQVTKLLRDLEQELGCSIDVIYTKDKNGYVKPESVQLVVPEKTSDAGKIIKVQCDIRWWVERANGNVDFFDRSRTDLDEYIDRRDELAGIKGKGEK